LQFKDIKWTITIETSSLLHGDRDRGLVQRHKNRKEKLLKLLNGETISWNTSLKLHAELDHVKQLLLPNKSENGTAHATTYTAISNANNKVKVQPPQKKKILALKKKCPRDCQGPLYSSLEHTRTARGGNHQQQQE